MQRRRSILPDTREFKGEAEIESWKNRRQQSVKQQRAWTARHVARPLNRTAGSASETRRVRPSFAISMIYGRFTRRRLNPRTRRNDEKSREILTHIRTAVVTVLFMLSNVRHIALRVTSHPRLRATVTSRFPRCVRKFTRWIE